MSPEERLAYHREHSGPLMDELMGRARRELEHKVCEPNSKLGSAYQYLLNHEPELRGFLTYPGAPLDNNLSERLIKYLVLNRKNAYFYKTTEGSQVADIITSLGISQMQNGGNPYKYFIHLQQHVTELAENPEAYLPHKLIL